MKIAREVAEQEITKWLDHKKIFASTREKSQDAVDMLVDAMEEGALVLNEDFTLTQILLVPAETESPVRELKYLSRLNETMKKPYMKGEDPTDAEAQLTATIAALTSTAKGIIRKLDSVDKRVANSIANFFF